MKEKLKQQPQIWNHKLTECPEYFNSSPVWKKIFRGFKEKYVSYGTFSGKVKLTSLTDEEIEILEGFFGKNFHGQKSVTISAEKFTKALEESKFAGISSKELLSLYFQEKMEGKKEIKERKVQQWEESREMLLEKYKGTPVQIWLKAQQVLSFTEEEMKLISKMIQNLPVLRNKKEYLAIYAAGITGNPHAFDKGTKESNLLKQAVKWYAEQTGFLISKQEIFDSLNNQKLYLHSGILMDDVSNYCMVFGIRAWKKDGALHRGIEGFSEEGDMLQLSLHTVADLGRIICPGNRLYIVENPSIYAVLFSRLRGKAAGMCMNGQPRMSSLLLLDLLDENTTIFYAGDYDPEGLLIAQKIKQYYKGKCIFKGMSVENYIKSMSKKDLAENRIKMLDKIVDPDLVLIAEEMKILKKAGYQENYFEEELPLD